MSDMKQWLGLMESALNEKDPCWKGYKQIGMKKKGGKQVPNCVPEGMQEGVFDDMGMEDPDLDWMPKSDKDDNGIPQVGDTYKGGYVKKVIPWDDGETKIIVDHGQGYGGQQNIRQYFFDGNGLEITEGTDFRKGDSVKHARTGEKGIVLHKGNRDEVVVKFGSLNKSLPASELRLVDELDEADVCPQCGSPDCTCKPGECDCEPVKETDMNSIEELRKLAGLNESYPMAPYGEEGSCVKEEDTMNDYSSIPAELQQVFKGMMSINWNKPEHAKYDVGPDRSVYTIKGSAGIKNTMLNLQDMDGVEITGNNSFRVGDVDVSVREAGQWGTEFVWENPVEDSNMGEMAQLRKLAGLNESYPMAPYGEEQDTTDVNYSNTKRMGDASVTVSAHAKSMDELHKVLAMAGLDPSMADNHVQPEVEVEVEPVDDGGDCGCGDTDDMAYSTDKQALVDMLRQKLQNRF